jgi:polyferredoxin
VTGSRRADLLQWPILGAYLRWRHFRTTNQIVLLVVASAIVLHGLLGPDLAPQNLATVLTWVHYRGLLIGVLLIAANAFCSACPMILVRDLARRAHMPVRRWPRWLGRKWVAVVLFAVVLYAYELFDLWALPAATAWVVIGYFGAALLVDLTFKGATFCTHVCPVGQFNFIASTLSPLELRPRDRDFCRTCATVDCIRGRRVLGSDPSHFVAPICESGVGSDPAHLVSSNRESRRGVRPQRGCELALFLPVKTGNLDCTFCLDCVQACPHDNVAIGFRVPGDELADDRRRSSIGRLSRRPDLAALSLVFTFGALLNGFAMTGPAYAVESAIAGASGFSSEAVSLGLMFVLALMVVPLALCAFAALATHQLTTSDLTVSEIGIRFAYALVPLGAGVWLAHYAFHFLTGVGTIVPVTQSAMLDASGRAWLGEPNWAWLGMRAGVVFPFEIGAVVVGALGSVALAYRIAEREYPRVAGRAAIPWLLLVAGLLVLALWIIALPMEMRGTALGG